MADLYGVPEPWAPGAGGPRARGALEPHLGKSPGTAASGSDAEPIVRTTPSSSKYDQAGPRLQVHRAKAYCPNIGRIETSQQQRGPVPDEGAGTKTTIYRRATTSGFQVASALFGGERSWVTSSFKAAKPHCEIDTPRMQHRMWDRTIRPTFQVPRLPLAPSLPTVLVPHGTGPGH